MAVLAAFQRADDYESLRWRVDDSTGDVSLFAGCSDFFHLATADCEEVKAADIALLGECLEDLEETGEPYFLAELFAARKRGMRPLAGAYKDMDPPTRALFDACSTEEERVGVDRGDAAFWQHVAKAAREVGGSVQMASGDLRRVT